MKVNMLDLRGLAGEVLDVHASQETIQLCWCPGNGYRYPIRVSYVAPGQAAAIGCAEESKHVSMQVNGYGWVGLCVGGSRVCTLDYIEEKLGGLMSPVQLQVFTVAVNVLLPQCETSYGREIDEEMRKANPAFRE